MSEYTPSSAEDLDALPHGSIVRSDDGQIWEKRGGWWDCLSENGEGGKYESATVIWQTSTPTATVLWRPDAPHDGAQFDQVWLAAHDAEMRERVAQEIEADWDREGCGERDFCHGWVHANQSAAHIARGEADHRP